MTDDDNNLIDSTEPLSPEILEKLAHPLRQKILLYIEKEVEVGYKDLKNECQVATGTLYHHLKILKDLIEQNEQKKYILTPKGQEMLNHLFIDNKQPVKANQIEQQLDQNTLTISGNTFILSSNSRTNDIFYSLFHLPSYFYQIWIVLYLIIGTASILMKPTVVFFDFIPFRTSIDWIGFVPLIWTAIAGILLNIVAISSKHTLTLASWGIFFFYADVNIFLTLLVSTYQNMQVSIWLEIFSIFLQGIYIFMWTTILSVECWSWERSLLTAVVQNYLILFFIP